MRRLLTFYILLQGFFTYSQTTENFDDGDFADNNPLTWTASQESGGNDFIISSGELQSNGPGANASLFFSTNLGVDFTTNDVTWTFKARYDGGAPSSSNYVEIYLMSDVADVSGSSQGYYIRLGESNATDGIDLFSTNSGTAIISDAGDQVAAGIDAHIRVTRTAAGNWTLEADAVGGDSFSTIGTVTNSDFSSGDFFGFFVRHSSTKNQDFFFDDVTVTLTPIPDTTPPTIQSTTAISDTEVDVLFSENVDQTTAENGSNYVLDGAVTVSNATRDGSNLALVHLTTSSLTNGDTYAITINNIEDENSNVIAADSQDPFEYLVIEEAEGGDVVVNEFHAAPNSESAIPNEEYIELLNISDKFIQLEDWTFSDASGTSNTFPSFRLDPNEYVILTNTGNGSSFNSYGDVLEVANFRALNNGGDDIIITNSSAIDIYTITYTSSTSGVSTELINPNGPDYSLNNYGLSTDLDGGTPGAINSIFDDTPDTTPPAIEEIKVVSSTELDVTFSETIQESTANVSGNYSIDGGITLSSAARDVTDNTLVHLTVSELVSGDIRTLTINNVTDLSGNAIDANSTINFEYILTEEAIEGDLVINEFYAAPSSEAFIPNVEYVELFNRSEKFIDLENWTLSDQSGSSSPFGSYIIRPDSFVILTETDNGVLFDSHGDWVEVGNFPTLNNGGDSIIISNSSAFVIHEIKYASSSSGFSTELINPNGPDYSFRNYDLSTYPDGGTPGMINSIFDDTPDTTPPSLDSISVVSQTIIEVYFDELLEETSAENIANYSIDGGIVVNSAQFDELEPTRAELAVSELVSGDVRRLTVNGVADLSGNPIVSGEIDFRYINIEEAEQGDVVINEFYASPSSESPLPNREFVELFNLSDKYIDLANWTFSDLADTSAAFPSFILEPDSFLIIAGTSAVSLFEPFGNVIGVGSFQSLNSEDSIIFRNSNGIVIHAIEYSTSMSGITTELINPNGPDYSYRNYGLSTNPNGGTPGAINSIFDDTPDTTDPVLDSIIVISSTELEIIFDEPLEEGSAENVINYSIDEGITVNTARRDDADYAIVHLTVSELVSGDFRTLTVNNVSDLSLNAIAGGEIDFRYINIEEAEEGDVVINEFYANPNEESELPDREFIELFNKSNKYIDVENWKYADASDTSSFFPSFILEPDSFLILTTSSGVPFFEEYGNAIGIGSFSSLRSANDSIIVMNASASVIHAVEYSASMSGITTELINPNGPDYSYRNYGLSTDISGGTPGTINSIFDDTPDTTDPVLDSIIVISSTELEIIFDEPLEEGSAESAINYSIDEGITVNTARRGDADYAIVHLTVSELVSGDFRTLTVNNVTDLSLNAISGGEINFRYINIEEVEQGDVVINEFYANPNEESELPDREFIELFNRSNKYIDVENWKYTDASDTSSFFPSFILEPDSFLILTTSSGVPFFEEYGNAIGIGSFSSLRSANDSIIVMNASALVIHAVEYSASMSGITTELINPNGPDYSYRNYGLSTNPNGGTPGAINSIFDDTPDTTDPVIERITVSSSTELNITFNEPLDKISAEISTNYSIDGSISISSSHLYDTANHIVHLIVSELPSAEVQTLTINNVADLSGNTIDSNSTIEFEYLATEEAVPGDILINEFLANPKNNNDDFIELWNVSDKYIQLKNWKIQDNAAISTGFSSFIMRPNQYVIIYDKDATIDFPSFGNAISIPSLTLNNTNDEIALLSSDSTTIAFISYTDQPKEGVSSELINPNDPCITRLSYDASISSSGNTVGTQNSIFNDTPDSSLPMITSYNFDDELSIHFSESMDMTSLQNGRYEIDGLSINQIITSSENLLSVTISFSEILELGTLYQLSVSGVADCWGNVIEPAILSFGIGRMPKFNEILITEIMADPDPAIVLPDREYIEIYNATDDIISLDGVVFSDESSSTTLSSITINPTSYLALTTSTGAAEFLDGAIGVSSFPSLSNTGEQLVLSLDQNLLFSVTYDKDWHSSIENEVGGVSLEMIDISNPCAEANNWTSSTDAKRGTPGKQNAVNGSVPDNFSPEIVKVTAVNSESIRIDFNEKVDPTLVDLVNASIDPQVGIGNIIANYLYPKSLFLALSENLIESTLYTLEISNVSDCNGNATKNQTYDFALPSVPSNDEVLLSEVLFNPYTNGVDFVELYNNSDSYLDLQHWQLANLTDGEIDNQKEISNIQLVLEPRGFIALSINSNLLFTNYPKGNSENFYQVEALPNYANTEGTVVLINQDSIEVERFSYFDDFHYGLLNSVDGVSLERISYAAVNDENNWRSASSTIGFATPGYQNSQSFQVQVPKGTIEIEPKVFLPGNSGSGRDFTLISYQLETAGQFANISVYDQSGRLVKTLAEGILLSNAGFIRWDGTTNNGALARMGYHVVLFEIYDSNGNSQTLKETVVVGRDF